MPRFVLLHHECPPDFGRPSHWDFMFEVGGVLRTWTLAELPREWQSEPCEATESGNTVDAEQLPDHRLSYLDYEGPIGGGRGHVVRVDSGTMERISNTTDRWEIRLVGGRLRGTVVLARKNAAEHGWTLTVRSGG